MSPPKNAEDKPLVRNMKAQVFLQFVLIFMVILCVILLTSTSLYTNIITGMTLSNLRDAVDEVKLIDVTRTDNVTHSVEEIERKLSVFIEVYSKDPGDKDDEYSRIIYTKFAYDSFYDREGKDLTVKAPLHLSVSETEFLKSTENTGTEAMSES